MVVGGTLGVGGADDGEREALLHEVEIHGEAADAAVAVDEGVDLGEAKVKIGGDLHGVTGGSGTIPSEEVVHVVGDFERIGWDVAGAGDTHRHSAVATGPLVLDAAHDEGVELEKNGFGEDGLVGDETAEELEGCEVVPGFEVVFEGFAVDGEAAADDDLGLGECEGVALDGVGLVDVVGLFGFKDGGEAAHLLGRERAAGIETGLESVDLGEVRRGFHGFRWGRGGRGVGGSDLDGP